MTDFVKSDKAIIRIEESEFKGKKNINLREFMKWGDSDEHRPTKHGFTIPPERWEEFVAAVNEFEVSKARAAKKAAPAKAGPAEDKSTAYFIPMERGEKPMPKARMQGVLQKLVDDTDYYTSFRKVVPSKTQVLYKVYVDGENQILKFLCKYEGKVVEGKKQWVPIEKKE